MRAQVTLAELLERPDLEPARDAATAEPALLQLFVPAPAPMPGQLSLSPTRER